MPSSDYETQIKELGGILQNIMTPQDPTIYGTDFGSQMEDVARQLQNLGVNPTAVEPSGFFSTILGGLGQIGSAVTPAIPAIAGTLLTGEAYERLSDVGREAQREALALAERGQAESQFRPFTVTTATGGQFGTRVTPTGAVETTMGLSPEELALQRQLFGGAGQFFGQAQAPTVTREQQIFERMRAAQRPEEERQQLALEERLAAQGRLGTRSAAYGGATPEQLAMATAREEARTRSMLGAMQQAQAEQAQQAALGQQLLGASYLPQAQLLSAVQPAQRMGELQQQAQLYGTGLFGETAMSGLESRLLAEQARANLLGGVGSNILAGMFTPQVTKSGTVIDPGGFGDLGGLFGGVTEGLGNIIRGIGGIFD
jgi:hypothetical protein